MKKARAHFIENPAQMRALRAGARQEVVDVLAQMGTVSVRELAAALGRPADALYFHLRALVRAGLVQEAGSRIRGHKKEALFRTCSPELRLIYDPSIAANQKAVSAIVTSMMRLGVRDFVSAFKPGNAVMSGAGRELWALRKTGRLTKREIVAVNRGILGLADGFSAKRSRGRLYAITVLITPLDHRNKGGTTRGSNKERNKGRRKE